MFTTFCFQPPCAPQGLWSGSLVWHFLTKPERQWKTHVRFCWGPGPSLSAPCGPSHSSWPRWMFSGIIRPGRGRLGGVYADLVISHKEERSQAVPQRTEACSLENGTPAIFSTHVSQQTCAVLISFLAHCSAQGQH